MKTLTSEPPITVSPADRSNWANAIANANTYKKMLEQVCWKRGTEKPSISNPRQPYYAGHSLLAIVAEYADPESPLSNAFLCILSPFLVELSLFIFRNLVSLIGFVFVQFKTIQSSRWRLQWTRR
jgi:hypothetical protein